MLCRYICFHIPGQSPLILSFIPHPLFTCASTLRFYPMPVLILSSRSALRMNCLFHYQLKRFLSPLIDNLFNHSDLFTSSINPSLSCWIQERDRLFLSDSLFYILLGYVKYRPFITWQTLIPYLSCVHRALPSVFR